MSIFDMVRGYAPAIAGPRQSELPSEIVNVHYKQFSSRALRISERPDTTNLDSAQNVSHDKKVHYFQCGPKCGEWHDAYDRKTGQQILLLSTSLEHRENLIRCAFEDVRKVPLSAFLKDLNTFMILFFRSESIIMEASSVLSREKKLKLLLNQSIRWK